MIYRKAKAVMVIIFFLSLFSKVSSQDFPDEQWLRIVHPTFSGWDANKLAILKEYVVDSTAITGMVVIHDGKIVFEYGNIKENSYIASCRKSVLAMLYGKHVMNGTIDLDKSLADLELNKSEQLLASESLATIRDIISARSGIYLPASNRGDFLHLAPERGSVKPGAFWLYSNWDFNMAGHIFEKESNSNIYDEIQSQFAIPLNMQDWDRNLQEKSGDLLVSDHMAYHIWFSVRDMARLGWMLANDGKWNDGQVLHPEWIKEMTAPTTSFEEVDNIAPFMKDKWAQFGYGYMWWLWDTEDKNLKGAYSALGAWGQNLTVLPELNSVVVIKTNSDYGRRKGNHNAIISEVSKIYNETAAKTFLPLAKNLEQQNLDEFLTNVSKLTANEEMNLEDEINALGYRYLFDEKIETAIKLFKFNVAANPDSWNVYDSLAEGFL